MSMEKIKFKNGEALPLQKLSNYYSSPIILDKDERVSGLYAWLALLAAVAAYDAYAIKTKKVETLTRFFWRSTEHPTKSLVPISIWLLVTGHLLLEKNIRKNKFNHS